MCACEHPTSICGINLAIRPSYNIVHALHHNGQYIINVIYARNGLITLPNMFSSKTIKTSMSVHSDFTSLEFPSRLIPS